MNTPPTISLREHLLAGHGMECTAPEAPSIAWALPLDATAEPTAVWLPANATAKTFSLALPAAACNAEVRHGGKDADIA